jgi:hypothetical protein
VKREPMTTEAHVRDVLSVNTDIASLRIVARDALGFTLRAPRGPFYWTRFLVTPERLIVIGDVPDLIFDVQHESPEQAVRWLGAGRLAYLAGRVKIGEAHLLDERVALADIEEHLAEYDKGRAPEWLTRAHEGIRSQGWSMSDLREHMDSSGQEHELWRSWGETPSVGVIMAKTVARRLVALLDEEGAERARKQAAVSAHPCVRKPPYPGCAGPRAERFCCACYFVALEEAPLSDKLLCPEEGCNRARLRRFARCPVCSQDYANDPEAFR